MTQPLRATLISLRELLVSFGPFVALTLGLLALAYWWLQPNPPHSLVLATGPEQGAYEAFGQRYAQALAKQGIRVELRRTEGSAENLDLLRSGQADFGFVQGGSGQFTPDDQEQLHTLGNLFVEPLWVFYRHRVVTTQGKKSAPPLETLPQLKSLRVNVDRPGSGVPQLFTQLLEANGMTDANLRLHHLPPVPATVALLEGQIDALVFVTAPESQLVQMLLMTPGIGLMDWRQAQAYSRRFNFLQPEVLPRGVVDLARNLPSQDKHLVATTTSLLAREGTHPALVQLMAQTALDIHGSSSWFNHAHEYPNLKLTELPVAPAAERAVHNGQPWLQRHLPFWLANLIERMWLAMGLILALVLPLSRMLPPLYTLRIRSRVFRWYAQLRDIESRTEEAPADRTELLQELDTLETRTGKISIPLAYADELYALRQHIELVRQRLLRQP